MKDKTLHMITHTLYNGWVNFTDKKLHNMISSDLFIYSDV